MSSTPTSAPPAATSPPAGRSRRPLSEALDDPAFTPRRRDLPALVELLGEADSARASAIEEAILRIGPAVADGVSERLEGAGAPLRGRLVRILGRWASERPELVPRLLALLEDGDPKAQRNAIIALGKLDDPRIAPALLALAAAEARLPHLRSLADALGKVGGEAALAWLRGLDDRGDPELDRLRRRALLIAERSLQRDAADSEVDLEAILEGPTLVDLHVRRGLEGLLIDELEAAGIVDEPEAISPGCVRGRARGRLGDLWRARLALEVVFPGPTLRPGDEVEAIVAALARPELRARLRAWTRGPIRYRLVLPGGHRRAAVWAIADALRARAPELINDPSAATWELRVTREDGRLALDVAPRRVADPRFTYRRGDVPAASHPTIAAALARLAGVRADDVIWDPFVGSGLELCERGLLGPYRRLWGSDLDARALAVARENLAAAGLDRWELLEGDARALEIPGGVTCVITNPPLGRRVRGPEGLLCEALGPLAANLRPGGRLVWITPEPAATRAAATAAGLRPEVSLRIDLGGFAGTIERWALARR